MEDELDMLFRWHEIDDPKLLETVKTIRQSARDNALAYAAKHGFVAPPEPKSPAELMEGSDSKLKPCPFCGADARELAHDQIECSNIECVSFRHMALSFPRELWNTRATSSERVSISRECAEKMFSILNNPVLNGKYLEDSDMRTPFFNEIKVALEKT